MSIAVSSNGTTAARQVFYATYVGLEGRATVLDATRVLFQSDDAAPGEGQVTLAANDPDLLLHGACDLADAQRAADLQAHPWYRALQSVAQRAKDALGVESHTRIDRALAIVQKGDVQLTGPHTGYVASQSRPHTTYAVNGHCGCADFQRAPAHLCMHKIAVFLTERALELAEPPADPVAEPPVGPVPTAATPVSAGLPEAPASVTLEVVVSGHSVRWTLRDQDEARLAERLAALLARYPAPATAAPAAAPDPTMPLCSLHGVPMKAHRKNGQEWFSHKHQGGWCRGKEQGR
ncbi:MAG: hypothetical protein AB7R40_25310 [Nitrospiraceae bacterium]